MKNKVLVVAAHPDDEVLGCGATIARMTSAGDHAVTLILGEGITSRDWCRRRSRRSGEINDLRKQMVKANKAIGVDKVYSFDLPDNRFDTVPLLDIVKIIEKVKCAYRPDIVFTHFSNDMNIDHLVTNKAVLTATRPMPRETVKKIYAFEVLSSTEWNFPLSFSPNYFVDVQDSIDKKIASMSIYKDELRDYPHPRSLKAIELNAQYWGVRTGLGMAEAFQILRVFE